MKQPLEKPRVLSVLPPSGLALNPEWDLDITLHLSQPLRDERPDMTAFWLQADGAGRHGTDLRVAPRCAAAGTRAQARHVANAATPERDDAGGGGQGAPG